MTPRRLAAPLLPLAFMVIATPGAAHCDSVRGPVVAAARAALEAGDARLVLHWVAPQDEALVTAAFQEAVTVRALGPDAQRLADRHFLETLVRLHRAHVERIPYETFWIHLGEGWDVDPFESTERIARGRRGGYCYHLNGAFALLLDHLGYEVTRHVAGVHDAAGPSPSAMTNHLALAVHGLPTASNPGGRWYVDVGLGDAVHEPLPLVSGVYRHGPLTFGLTAPGDGDWHLAHDPSGSFAGVSVCAEVTGMEAFEARHRFNATSPESSFAQTVNAQRRHAGGVDTVRGCVLSRKVGATTTTETFERQTPAFYTSGRLLDDGIIDPRDSRRVLAHVLHLFRRAAQIPLRPLSFGVARS
jgi:arylamine N-acetyltransferase